MVDRLKKIPARFMEFWNKYTSKQKTIIISVVAVVFLALVILFAFLNRTQYTKLYTFETTAQSSEAVDLMKDQKITYKLSSDGLVLYVDKKKMTDAKIAIGNSKIPSTGMTLEDATNNSMSTTNDERVLKATHLKEDELRKGLLEYEGVKDAIVYIHVPKVDYTILSENKETSVSIMLTTDANFQKSTANALAESVANAVGNTTTDNVRITNQKGELLFGGKEDFTNGGNIATVTEFKNKLTNEISNKIYSLLINMGYDDAEIAPNFDYNMDKVNILKESYTPAEGQEQGVKKNDYNFESKGGNYTGGIPGTTSNENDTTVNIQSNGSSEQSTTVTKNEYQPNKEVITTEKAVGTIVPENSSISVVLTKYRIYKEDELKKQGVLKQANMTWDEYVTANSQITAIDNPGQEVYDTVANATGIDADKMTITAYEKPIFQASSNNGAKTANYLMIVLAVLIIALLIFVVFKGTAPVEVTEVEPELSVEQLLATTKENQSLDDIEFSEKSETRKLIEKFVDENPEAVAQLLRNWLNEDWG